MAVALLVRLAYLHLAVGLNAPPEYDGVGYDQIARNLLSGQGLALDQITAFRPPGYPLFVAAVYAVTRGSLAALRVVQALLGCATVAVVYRITAQALRSSGAALVAAGIAAFHPVSVYLAGIIYPEVLASLLLALALWSLGSLPGDRRPSALRMASLGTVLGFAALLRPALLLAAAVFFAYAALLERRHARWPWRSALVPVAVLACLVPWAVRNALRFGEFIPLATEGGVTFWGGNHPLSHGGHLMPSPDTWLGADPPHSMYGWPGLSETESERRFYRAALAWMRAEPVRWAALLPQKLARSWTLAFGNEARSSTLPVWVGAAYLVYPASVLAGVVLSWRLWRKLVPVYLVLLAQTATTAVFYGSTRQAAVVIPAATVLSAAAVVGVLRIAGRLWERRPG